MAEKFLKTCLNQSRLFKNTYFINFVVKTSEVNALGGVARLQRVIVVKEVDLSGATS